MSLNLELVKISGIKKRRGEERQDYLKRVVLAIQKIDEDVWDDMSEEAKEFYNKMAERHAAGESIPDFKTKEGDGKMAKKKTTKTSKVSKPSKKKTTSSDNENGNDEAPAKAKKERQKGAQQMIKKIVLDDPKLPIDDVCTKVEAEGFTLSRSSVVSIRGGFLDSMRVIQDAGRLKKT